MKNAVAVLAAVGLLSACAAPEALRVDFSESRVLLANGEGQWNYLCKVSNDGKQMEWANAGPVGTLKDLEGRTVAQITAGPTFVHTDGSSVDGVVKVRAASDPAGAVDQMLYTGIATGGKAGVFSKVTSIQQIRTSGGAAPKTGCAGGDDLLKTVTVPFKAEFRFFAR